MQSKADIVITGVGVVSPIGVGTDAFWESLVSCTSGVASLDWRGDAELRTPIGGAVKDFDAAPHYIRPRKNLKIMGREIQLGVAAAELACRDSRIEAGRVAPERFGVVFGADTMVTELSEVVNAYRACIVDGQFCFARWGEKAMTELFPLWMLKYLPNMPACHIGIAHNARGPNNSHTLGEASGLTSLAEAAGVIQRGQADVMIAGGTSTRIHPLTMSRYYTRQVSRRVSEPAAACRPFDADRDGLVLGEGAAAYVLETRQHAEARGAVPIVRVAGSANCLRGAGQDALQRQASAIRHAIESVLRCAQFIPSDVGHVNANGLSTTEDDEVEAQAIHDLLGDVPVTAPKSYFGNLGAGTGAVEMAASVLALRYNLVPPTLNYQHPDPRCPIRVVHNQPMPGTKPVAMSLNHTANGQAVAVVLTSPD